MQQSIHGRYPEFPEPVGTPERIEIPQIPEFFDEGIKLSPRTMHLKQ